MNPAALAAVAAVGAAALAFVGSRLIRSRAARLKAEVRPILFAALDRGEVDPEVIDALDRRRQRALEAAARSLLPNLRGQDRDVLTRLLEHRGVVDEARRQTRSPSAAARARAGAFLGAAGTSAAVPDLVALLHDEDPEVRWAAARALGRIGDVSAVSPLLSALEGRHPLPVELVIDAVSQIRDCPVSLLRQGLRSRSVPTRAATVELLGRVQALAATADVIELLDTDPSLEVRARAARALGRIGSPHAVEPLLARLDAGPMAVRTQAAWALGEVAALDAVPSLRRVLLGPSRQLSEAAAKALARIVPVGPTVLAQVAEGDGQAAESARLALQDTVAPSLV